MSSGQTANPQQTVRSIWSTIWRWSLTSFAGTVALPIVVLAIVLSINEVGVSASTLFGRGELFLLSLGLLGGATGLLTRASRRISTVDEVLVMSSIWTLVLTAVCWGSINALTIAHRPYADWIPTWGGAASLVASTVLAGAATAISAAVTEPTGGRS